MLLNGNLAFVESGDINDNWNFSGGSTFFHGFRAVSSFSVCTVVMSFTCKISLQKHFELHI